MKENYNFVGEAILNEFTVPDTTNSSTLNSFFEKGWLLGVFINTEKKIFVATFTHLLAN